MTKTPNPIQNSSQILKCDDGLRPYQKEAKRNIYKAWDEVQSVMFQMPTGTGKTVLFASIIRELDRFHVLRGARPIRVLVVAHRDVWLVKTADDYIAVIKDSDLGQRLTYIKEQSKSFYLKSVENQLWYFDHVSGFAKFYKNGILLEDADLLGASNVADEIKKIEESFLSRFINSTHSKTRSQLQKILPYLDKDSFPRYSEFEKFSHQD